MRFSLGWRRLAPLFANDCATRDWLLSLQGVSCASTSCSDWGSACNCLAGWAAEDLSLRCAGLGAEASAALPMTAGMLTQNEWRCGMIARCAVAARMGLCMNV